jgi:hypothetical protein
LLSCLVIAGCALHPGGANDAADKGSWSYKRVASGLPFASFGIANTASQLALECDPADGLLHLLIIDTEIPSDRAGVVKVADEDYPGFERLDPPDGFAVGRISIPLRERVVTKFAAGAGPLTVISAGEAWTMPHGREPIIMVQDCLRLRR